MEKLVYLVWDRPSTDRTALREEVIDQVAPRVLEGGAERLEVHVDDEQATIDGPMPPPGTELPVRVAFSFFVATHDRRSGFEEAVGGLGVRTAGYLVTESLVDEYDARGWASGERSSGITTFTVLRRNPTFEPRTFREFWYGHQSPMSGEVQPRVRYVRNTVVHPVTPGAPPYDGIVHESWPSADVVADPIEFHGGAEVGPENLRVMLDSVTQVFDLPTLRSVALSEYQFHD